MMTAAINTSTTSKQVREPTDRELTEGELDQVGGGGMAISFTEVKFSYKTGDTPSTPPRRSTGSMAGDAENGGTSNDYRNQH